MAPSRKRKIETSSTALDDGDTNLDAPSTPKKRKTKQAVLATPKKRKASQTGSATPKKKRVKQSPPCDDDDDDDDIPRYVSTKKPRGELLLQTAQGSWFKASDIITVSPAQIVPDQGTVTTYNLTQMSWRWIKILLPKLRDVIQHKVSHRGWRETILFSLAEANRPDDDDLRLEERVKELEKRRKREISSGADGEQVEFTEREINKLATGLKEWTPKWFCEPLYEMKILRRTFEDDKIIVLVLTSTHGSLYIRTTSDFAPWVEFWHWLDVKQANMKGYSQRRGGEWNGFEVTEDSLEGKTDLVDQVAEMHRAFEEHSCVAIWKTIPQPDEKVSYAGGVGRKA